MVIGTFFMVGTLSVPYTTLSVVGRTGFEPVKA